MAFILVQPNAAFMNINPAVTNVRKPREYRQIDSGFLDQELYERYRFKQDTIDYIVRLIENDLERSTRRNHALSPETQVKVFLRYVASGSFLQVIGDTIGVDKSTVSRIIYNVCEALIRKKETFICWPTVNEEKNRVKAGFRDIGGFPNVIGCIDGTHVRIQAPTVDEPAYVNRKGFHSVNVQAVCDHRARITNISACWPGSSHDSHIFRTSNLCQYLTENNRTVSDGFILGDSGYPCRPFLLTPYLNPVGPAQDRYNNSLCKTRVTIERTFGVLKRRFHVLHSEIRMSPERVCRLVVACAILHNIAIERRDFYQDDTDEDRCMPTTFEEDYAGPNDGKGIRDHIANTYFTH